MSKSNDFNVLLMEIKEGIKDRLKNESRDIQLSAYYCLWIDFYELMKTEQEIELEKQKIQESAEMGL